MPVIAAVLASRLCDVEHKGQALKRSGHSIAVRTLNMTTAFTVFVRQAVRQGKIPFKISLNIPNAETIAAMEEASRISRDPNAKRYSSFEELVAEIQNEV